MAIAERAAIVVRIARWRPAGRIEATSIGNVLVQARPYGALTGHLEQLRPVARQTQEPHRFEPRR